MKNQINKIYCITVFFLLQSILNFAQSNLQESFECHTIEQGSLNYPQIADVADFDGDGLLDIFVGTSRGDGYYADEEGSNHIAWYKNLGNKTYKKMSIYLRNVQHSFVHDFDNDGDADILYGAGNLFHRGFMSERVNQRADVGLLINDGQGNFTSSKFISRRDNRLLGLYTADFNNDGLMDFYVELDEIEYQGDPENEFFRDRGYVLFLYLNQGESSFERVFVGSEDHVDTGIIFVESALGDFNGDGFIDVVVRDWDTDFEDLAAYSYIYDGESGFTKTRLISNNLSNMNSIRAADVDDDGDLDVLSLTDNGGVFWYQNDGTGIFTRVYESVTRYENRLDLDGDGDIDEASFRNVWQENLGNNEFERKTFLEDVGSVYASPLDIDNDGDFDLIVSGFQDANNDISVSIYENDGNLNFTKFDQDLDGNLYWPEKVQDLDLDLDGDLDILAISLYEDELFWYQNDGNQNFTKILISDGIIEPQDFDFADFDLDGDIDIVTVSNGDEMVSWWQNDGNQNFSVQEIETSTQSTAVRVIDMNKDSYPDIIVADRDDRELLLYTNDQQGSFLTKTSLISDVRVFTFELVDLNNNGFEDLILADESNDELVYYRNNEGQGFSFAATIGEFLDRIEDIEIVDVDMDGDLDVFTSSVSPGKAGFLELWVNESQDNFTRFELGIKDPGFGAISTGDYDGDGVVDLISSDNNTQNNALRLWKNEGNYNFSSEIIDENFINGLSLVSTDLDGDGSLDLLAASNGSGIKWYEKDDNNGGSTNNEEDFSCNLIQMGSMNAPSSAVKADFDGDGLYDIYVGASGNGELEDISSNGGVSHVAWFKNLGDGEYEKHAVRAAHVHDSKVEDVDSDGDPDIIYVSHIGYQEDERTEYYFLSNNGDGTFEEYKIYEEIGSSSKEFFILDLNNDGLLDIYTLIDDFNLGVKMMAFYNDGQNEFSEMIIDAENHDEMNQIECATNHGDISGDGFEDLIIRYYNSESEEDLVYFYENDGDNGFIEYVVPVAEHRAISAIEIYDADEDGDLDFGSFGSSERIWFSYEGDGNFTSVESSVLAPGNYDWDGDGDLDRMSPTGFLWQENINNEYYETQQLLSSLSTDSYTSFMDVDEDGDLDIIHSFPGRLYEPNFVRILYNDGNQNFSEDYLLDSYFYWPEELKAVDLDLDGDLDLVLTHLTEEDLYWLENDGNQNFSRRFITERSIRTKDIVYADFDQDGDLDLVTLQDQASRGGRLWTNNGSMSFSSTFLSFDGSIEDSKCVELLDFNKDGYPDLIMSDIELDKVVLLLNDQNGGFIRDRNIEIIIEARSMAVQDMYDNGLEDIIIADAYDNELLLYRNNDGVDFEVSVIGTTLGLVDNLKVEDIDRDGDYDIITSSFPRDVNDTGQLLLWINDGTNNFTSNPLSADGSFDAITCGDYDGDGDIDIISAAYDVIDNGLTLWKNDGAQGFAPEPFDKNFFNGRALVSADLDGNGSLDLIGASNGSGIKWWSNDVTNSTATLVFDCPDDVSLVIPTLSTIVNYDEPALTSDCEDGAEVQVIAGPASGDFFDIGTTQVVFEATDNCGTEAVRCTVNFEIELFAPLELICIPDVIAYTEGNNTNVSWADPTFETECYDQNIVIQQTEGPPSGSVFPVGLTTITYSASTSCNSSASCTFNVLVEQEPVLNITCPDDITVISSGQPAIASWNEPTYETNCEDDGLININQVAGLPSGSTFPIGTTVITYEVSNECDNIETCSFNVIVEEQESELTIDCPEDIVVTSTGDPVNVSYSVNFGIATCTQGGFNLYLLDSPSSGSAFDAGTTTTITHIAFDNCGNEDTCRFDIIVELIPEVTLTCPDDVILNSNGEAVVATWDDPIFDTNCILFGFQLVQTEGPPSGSEFEIGTTQISYEFTDGCGEKASCSFSVIVQDENNTASISCPEDIYLKSSGGAIPVFWPAIDFSTTCSDGVVVLVQNGDAPGNGGLFEVGTTNVSYTARDGCDNTATCSFNVIIEEVSVDCPDSFEGFQYIGNFEGDKYFISNTIETWEDANEIAIANGGQLASINSVEENNFIFNNINELAYIGYSDSQEEGTFKWANADPVTYSGLSAFNTNSRDYTYINFWDGLWNLSVSFAERKFIMEVNCDRYSSCGLSANVNKVECDEDNLYFNMTVSGSGEVSEWKAIIYGEEYVGDYNEATELGPFSTYDTQFGLKFNVSDASGPCNTTVIVDVPNCPAEVSCPEELNGYSFLGEFEGHKYFISDIITVWQKAEELATNNGGYLVSINSAEENSFIENLINEYAFIGLSDNDLEGNLTWTSGEEVDYTNIVDYDNCFFCSPNNEENDFAHMNFWSGGWSFDSRWVERRHIVEFDCGGYGGGFTINDGGIILPRLAYDPDLIEDLEIEIYPNPVLDHLNLEVLSPENNEETLSIYDARGALLLERNLSLEKGMNEFTIDVESFPNAMYFLKFSELNELRKFIKKD